MGLKQMVYKALGQSVLDYAITVCCTCAKSKKETIDKAFNEVVSYENLERK